MKRSEIIRKLTSRKFWFCFAAMLSSLGASINGLNSDNQIVAIIGIICTVVSAAIYSICEAAVDASNKKPTEREENE